MYQEDFINSFDGTKLFVRKDYVTDPLATVILVHGLSESSNRYRHIAKVLNDNQYNVISFDNRGNGRSGGNIGDVNSFHDFLDDLHLLVELAKKDFNQKVFVLGHSLGGFIVNAYGAKYNDVDGIISSGAVGIFLKQVNAFRFIPFKPFKKINVKNVLADVLSHDPQIKIDYQKDPYVNKTNKVNLFGECFVKGVRYIHKNIDNLTIPILHLHGSDDQIVPKESSIYLNEHVGSVDKQLIIYDGFYHEIFNEVGKEQVFNDVLGWLSKHV